MGQKRACDCDLTVGQPWLQLLGNPLGFVPLLAVDEDVDGLFDEIHAQVEISSLRQARTESALAQELGLTRVCACAAAHVAMLPPPRHSWCDHSDHLHRLISAEELYGQICCLKEDFHKTVTFSDFPFQWKRLNGAGGNDGGRSAAAAAHHLHPALLHQRRLGVVLHFQVTLHRSGVLAGLLPLSGLLQETLGSPDRRTPSRSGLNACLGLRSASL